LPSVSAGSASNCQSYSLDNACLAGKGHLALISGHECEARQWRSSK